MLRAASRSGVLAALLQPAAVADVAARAAVAPDRVAAVLGVLEAFGVATTSDGVWSLSEGWQAVLRGESPMTLDAVLETGRVRADEFERCLEGSVDYWTLSPADRLTVARGVSFNPTSPVIEKVLRADLERLDGVVEALDSGGRVLELGCGVGSRLTALALLFPAMRGTGLELDAALVEYGRRRAGELGVADRVEYVVGDATTYRPTERFDVVNWSQSFFPEATRQAALATARDALRPGGWVTAPVIWADQPVDTASSPAQELALEGLLLDTWGVPRKTTHEVSAELRAAGFVDVRIDATPFVHLVRGRRPAPAA